MIRRQVDLDEKQAFLTKVRTALGRTEPLMYTPDHATLKLTLPRQQEKVRTVNAKAAARRSGLLSQFLDRAQEAGCNVHRVPSHGAAASLVADIGRSLGTRRAVRTSHEVFKRIAIDSALRSARITPITLASGRQRRRSDLWPIAVTAGLGITGVDYVVADTASCVILPRRGVSRIVSLAPPAIIVLVEESQVFGDLNDVLALRRLDQMKTRGRNSITMTFISGPSQTGDIEFSLTRGVHGPGKVYVILIG